jgi:hypothetical protein
MLEEAAVCEEGSSIQLLIAIASVILITAGHNDDAEIYSRFFLLCPLVDSLYIVSRAESRLDAIAFLFLILSICLSLYCQPWEKRCVHLQHMLCTHTQESRKLLIIRSAR